LFLLVACILWSGLTVNSLAPFVQVSAQQAIGPTKAQTIYASQPMWAALLSFFFLGETVGLQGLVGGGAFVSALFLAATSDKDPATIIEEED
jgi:drug/metabolite transporter (DMT)-like permease